MAFPWNITLCLLSISTKYSTCMSSDAHSAESRDPGSGKPSDCAGLLRVSCLSIIYNCTRAFWEEVHSFDSQDVNGQISQGCVAWQNYMNCLSVDPVESGSELVLPSGVYDMTNNSIVITVTSIDMTEDMEVDADGNDSASVLENATTLDGDGSDQSTSAGDEQIIGNTSSDTKRHNEDIPLYETNHEMIASKDKIYEKRTAESKVTGDEINVTDGGTVANQTTENNVTDYETVGKQKTENYETDNATVVKQTTENNVTNTTKQNETDNEKFEIQTAENNVTDTTKQNKSDSFERKVSVLAAWRFHVLATSGFYRKIGLCPELNTSELENLTSGVTQFWPDSDFLSTEKSRCYKSYPCFTEFLDAVGRDKYPCDVMKDFTECMLSKRGSCSALEHYAKVLTAIYQPLLEKIDQIPGFCSDISPSRQQQEDEAETGDDGEKEETTSDAEQSEEEKEPKTEGGA